ncbi:MAG: type I methionyl aminopeptidase, partial [Phototrophicales bacterium]
KRDWAKLREVNRIAIEALQLAGHLARPGVTTDYIDEQVHNFIIACGAYPSPFNYYQFPKSICTSLNEVICHGIPDKRPLRNGDILNVDVSVYKFGFHGDVNETYLIGQVSKKSKYLVHHTFVALEKAISMCEPGALYREIGDVIGKYIKKQ